MIRKKYSKYTYVNENDKSICTVDCTVYMDGDSEVEWSKGENGHYFPTAYNLDQEAAAEQKEQQGDTDRETSEQFRQEQHEQNVKLAEAKSAEQEVIKAESEADGVKPESQPLTV